VVLSGGGVHPLLRPRLLPLLLDLLPLLADLLPLRLYYLDGKVKWTTLPLSLFYFPWMCHVLGFGI